MPSATAASDVTYFWIPVATIVPTIAIGLVLEARFVAQSWTLARRWTRNLQACLWLIAGFSLFWTELTALSQMVHPEVRGEETRWAATLVATAFVIVVTNPLISLFFRGVADTDYLFSRWLRRLFDFGRRIETNSISKELDAIDKKAADALTAFNAGIDSEERALDDSIRAGNTSRAEGALLQENLRALRRKSHDDLAAHVEMNAALRERVRIVKAKASSSGLDEDELLRISQLIEGKRPRS